MNDATSDVLAAVEQIIQVPDTSTDNVQVPDTKSEEPTETAEAAPEPTPEVESEDQTEVEAEADEPSDNLELDDEFDDIDLAENVSESDTLITVKINGKEERWTLDQLKQSAAGQGYINQRMQEVAKLEKTYKAQTQALANSKPKCRRSFRTSSKLAWNHQRLQINLISKTIRLATWSAKCNTTKLKKLTTPRCSNCSKCSNSKPPCKNSKFKSLLSNRLSYLRSVSRPLWTPKRVKQSRRV